MIGIRINGPTFVYGDTQSILANTPGPDSVLKRNQAVLLSILSEKGQQQLSWELLKLCPMKIHLIGWSPVFIQGRRD